MMGPHFDTLILLSKNDVCTFLALATSELLPNEGRLIDQGLSGRKLMFSELFIFQTKFSRGNDERRVIP